MSIRYAAFIGLLCLVAAPPGWSQPAADTLQGGFRFFDPENPTGREAALLSLGPLVLGGARARVTPSGVEVGTCKEIVVVMLGSERAKRTSDSIKLKQKDHAVVFFVLADCVGEEEVCLAGASEPVAVSGCSGSLTLTKRGPIRGNAKVQCKDGIATSDPAFGLSAQEQTLLSEAFPDLAEKFEIKFKDRAGEEETGADLAFKIQNLDVDALDDVVGTYLADDALPLCGG